ncbi:MAG: RloB domain-containing protein [Armatimonadetes bacterium]|nr:RloB domain-containing protein [Armatimonadota bacterium]
MPPRRTNRTSSLRRRQGARPVRHRFLLLCEGEVTEREYFEYLRKEFRGTLVSIEISRKRGDPLGLVREAARLRREAASNARREQDDNIRFDSVWCVCDVDQHPRLEEAVRLARRSGVSMAVSNPCFELWPALHFDACGRFVTSGDLKSILRTYMPKYDKHIDLRKLDSRRAEATRRAVALERQHELAGRAAWSNPSTGVWKLVERLERFAGSPAPR